MERAVRGTKRRIAVGQSEGLDMAADRYLLGRQQARLAAHVKANRLTRDYSRERAHGVAQQPRALRVMPELYQREKFMPGPARGTSYDVDRKSVNGRSYQMKYESAGLPKRAAQSAYTEARDIPRDRDGTDGERMSVISWRTGRVVTDTFSHRVVAHGCGLTAEQVSRAKSETCGIVLLHNHPGNARPSVTDIQAVADNDWVKRSVVSCHDGTVYVVEWAKRDAALAYRRIREAVASANPGIIDPERLDGIAEEELYRNGNGKWFKVTKL